MKKVRCFYKPDVTISTSPFPRKIRVKGGFISCCSLYPQSLKKIKIKNNLFLAF